MASLRITATTTRRASSSSRAFLASYQGRTPLVLHQPQGREIEPLPRPRTAPLADPQPSLIASRCSAPPGSTPSLCGRRPPHDTSAGRPCSSTRHTPSAHQPPFPGPGAPCVHGQAPATAVAPRAACCRAASACSGVILDLRRCHSPTRTPTLEPAPASKSLDLLRCQERPTPAGQLLRGFRIRGQCLGAPVMLQDPQQRHRGEFQHLRRFRPMPRHQPLQAPLPDRPASADG